MDERKQWERQKGERARAFEAFCVYRDLSGKRSLEKAHDVFYGKDAANIRQIEKWSSANNWVARVAAYTEHLEAQRRAEYEAERIKQKGNRQAIIKNLETMLGRVMQANREKVLTADELNKLATAATKITNESRVEFDDLPTQRSEVSGKDGGPIQHEEVNADILAVARKRRQESENDDSG